MNRRRTIAGGVGVVIAVAMGGYVMSNFPNKADQKITLKSRILAYDKGMGKEPYLKGDPEEIVMRMMEDYFHRGMTEEECVRVLLANDLKVDERHTDVPDYRALPSRVYFNPSIVAVIHRPTWNPLVSFQYRLILRFTDGKLDQIHASHMGTGP